MTHYDPSSLYELIENTIDPEADTLQGLCHWFDMVLAQKFPSLWGNRSLLADLHALSLHGLSKHESKGNMYHQLTTDFLSLDKN